MTLSNPLQRVIKLITKPSVNRSKAEVDLLLPWLRKRSDLLTNLDTDILVTLMRHCSYQRVSRDVVIIKQGDTGDCFYIMLTGRTSVYIDTVKSDDEHVPPTRKNPASRERDRPSLSSNSGQLGSAIVPGATCTKPSATSENDIREELEEEFGLLEKGRETHGASGNKAEWALDRKFFGKFIITFDAGKSFGEIALISQDAVRNASIIADEDTDLLVIDRALFNGTLKKKQEAEYQQRKSFIRRCALFRNWSSKFRRLCEMSLRKVSLPFDSVLIKQGQPVIGLHFIIRGQGKVIVDPKLHKTQYPRIQDKKDDIISKEMGLKYQKRETKIKETSLREQIRVRRREGYAAAERRLAAKSVTMCYVDESEILGDTELILGLDTYSQSIICTTNTEVLILDNKNIERLIHKKNPHTLELLRKIVEDKLRSRTGMSVGSQVPLFTHLLNKMEEGKPRRVASAKSPSEDNKPRTIAETIIDRDVMVSQLSKLFIENKTPFIEPSVPGSLFYLAKSKERAERRAAMKILQRKARGGTGEVRLQRARKAARRQPRSRRELERLTVGSETQDMKQLQDTDHAVNKYYSTPIGGSRPKSAIELTGRRGSVFLTEHREHSETDGDQVHLGYRDVTSDSMQNIVTGIKERQQTVNANKSKIIGSLLERKHTQNSLMPGRPKSAPAPAYSGFSDDDEEEEEEEESFDWETSNHALKELEKKLQGFYERNESQDGNKKSNASFVEMKRFNVQGPDDVPIPGGTVYVRQRACQYPGGSNTEHHQHVRRFMIPKDAYRVAVRSLSAVDPRMDDRISSQRTLPSCTKVSPVRPYSSVTRRTSTIETNVTSQGNGSMTSQARIQSAPAKRISAWS